MARKPAPTQIPISTRALMERIKRRLAKDGELLRAMPPSSRWFGTYGPWYVVDIQTSGITSHSITDLGKLAKEIGCLKPHERWEK